MANKLFSAAKFLRPRGTSLLWLALLPAAAVLYAKHASVKTGENDSYIYTFEKKNRSGGAVVITNQTPSKLAKTAVKGCFTRKK